LANIAAYAFLVVRSLRIAPGVRRTLRRWWARRPDVNPSRRPASKDRSNVNLPVADASAASSAQY
jgi:hypothetical protein